MLKPNTKLWFFRAILLLIVVTVCEIIGFAGMWVNSRSVDFLSTKNYFNIRDMLIGSKDPECFPRYLSLPYLGYIPYPGYKKHGIVQHNEDGYRGDKISLGKTGKFRILCMGGSTTYGFSVDSPSQTFPAQLQVLANNYILRDSILNKKYSGAEVINAGLEAGNSAEELQQYQFKYRYYNADMVIVHSGVNDALLVRDANEDFQLDYTHSRRINFHLEPLPQPARCLMNSYLISFLSIRLFYSGFSGHLSNEFQNRNDQTFCRWSHRNMDSIVVKHQYDNYPFYSNSKNLFTEISNDSSNLVVFPNALNTNFVKSESYKKLCALNALLSKTLCKEYNGIYVPFEFNSIKDPGCWLDDCHVNAQGEKEKAMILYPYIVEAINSKGGKK
jgi:lysophospholipase L1-like esterase